MAHHFPTRREFRRLLTRMLSPEHRFYKIVIVYSLAISLLTLAVPISVQLLIDTIANIALTRSVVMISLLLFVLLLLSGALYALRTYAMELFTRRIYARISSEIALTALQAESAYFEEKRQTALFNRYFDIMTLKRNVPYVLTNGFTLVVQSVIGFVIVSMYHQYFFVFCAVLTLILWAIWMLWGWPAILTAFELSEAKHNTGAWLQTLAINNGVYKTPRHADYVLDKTDELINHHIDCQARHFQFTFRQLLSMLFLYAAASAILLGLGGMLVINGELTLGQLVAAELIMSAIFVGLPQMAGYLYYFFSICAAVEELGRFRDVKTERPDSGDVSSLPASPDLEMRNVKVRRGDLEAQFSLKVPGNSLVRGSASPLLQRTFCDLVRRYRQPESGLVQLGGIELAAINLTVLRQAVMVIDRPTLLDMTLRKYLELYRESYEIISVQEALEMVELDQVITELPDGMDTQLSPRGWPLTLAQAARLKLCAALLHKPRVLIMGEIMDVVPAHIMHQVFTHLHKYRCSLYYFTLRSDLSGFTHQLNMTNSSQTLITLRDDG